MASKWAVIAERGLGGDFSYDPRWYFDTKAEADSLARRLGRAASITYMLQKHPQNRQGPDHADWLESALKTLRGLDPDADALVTYQVKEIVTYAPIEEPAPANSREQMFRAMRDLG